jgi:hypothetical protein
VARNSIDCSKFKIQGVDIEFLDLLDYVKANSLIFYSITVTIILTFK